MARHAADVVRERRAGAPPTGLTGRPVPSPVLQYLQRASGNAAVAGLVTVSRDRPPAGTRAPSVPFPPFGDLTTYAQLAAAARFGIGQIQADLRDAPAGDPVHERARDLIGGLRAWLPYLQRMGDAPLSAAAAAQARLHLDEATAVRQAIADARQAVVRREMRRVEDAARAAAQRAEQLRPRLDNALRAAFRSGDTGIIRRTADVVGNVVDIGLGLHDLARQTAEAAARLRQVELAPVGRYVAALNRLNSGLAALNLAFSLTDESATTELEEGTRQLTVAAGAFSSLGTLAGLPAHMGLYANLYLVPLTNAIMAGISRLTDALHEENKTWVEVFGRPLRFSVEPGGEAMWDYMVALMRASDESDAPRIPSAVARYLVEHRARFEAGAGEEVPTTGWWFWRSLHTRRASDWLFGHRARVWALLYGSMRVPGRAR